MHGDPLALTSPRKGIAMTSTPTSLVDRADLNSLMQASPGFFLGAASHVLPKAIFWEANPTQVFDFS